MSPEKEIFLIDGASFLFRAYHAMGKAPLTTSQGRPTQAIFGMINMLRSLIKETQPQYIAVIMDAKGKNFRHDIYPDYKANRPPMPDDLRDQLETILEIMPAMGLPLISIPGFEADDVIGTLTKAAVAAGFRTTIISGDKDLTQLIDDHVTMIDTMKKVQYDRDSVKDKFGVTPEQIIDYLALVGDTSDNIPGIPKVGPKTAVKWLDEYQTIDNIIKNASNIGGKVGENLRENIEQLLMSRQLTTIDCDVDLTVRPEALVKQPEDIEILTQFYKELEFNSWLKELGHQSEDTPKTKTNYQTILDQEAFSLWVEKLAISTLFAFDTETSSLDSHQAELVGLSFAITPNEAIYIPLNHQYVGAPKQLDTRFVLDALRPILANPDIHKVAQNGKFDLEILQRYDIIVNGFRYDTMLMSYLLEAGQTNHDMDTLALRHLDRKTTSFTDIAGKGVKQLTFDQIDIDIAGEYAAEDADITLQLYQHLKRLLENNPKLMTVFETIEMPLVNTLVRIESKGVKIDADRLAEQSRHISTSLKAIEEKAFAIAEEPFNINSPKQIQHILFDKLELPILRKTPKGQPSTAENVLSELAEDYPLPELILEHRGLAKLKSTYTDKLPQEINPTTGRVHTSYHQAVAATGRLSSNSPNLQNIPIRTETGRQIREAFIAEPGFILLAADYSQIELRIMAHLSEDPGLINAFQQGIDVHSATAAEVFGDPSDNVSAESRRRAKAINFGLIYGMSAFGLARQLKIDQKQAKEYIDIYFERYPGVLRYMDETKATARNKGYVETLFGRRLNLPDIHSKNANVRQYAERTAINAPMQGTAADLIKKAMLSIDTWLNEQQSDTQIIMQVHDELVFEVPESDLASIQAMVETKMCQVAELKVPLIVDCGSGSNWRQAH